MKPAFTQGVETDVPANVISGLFSTPC